MGCQLLRMSRFTVALQIGRRSNQLAAKCPARARLRYCPAGFPCGSPHQTLRDNIDSSIEKMGIKANIRIRLQEIRKHRGNQPRPKVTGSETRNVPCGWQQSRLLRLAALSSSSAVRARCKTRSRLQSALRYGWYAPANRTPSFSQGGWTRREITDASRSSLRLAPIKLPCLSHTDKRHQLIKIIEHDSCTLYINHLQIRLIISDLLVY